VIYQIPYDHILTNENKMYRLNISDIYMYVCFHITG